MITEHKKQLASLRLVGISPVRAKRSENITIFKVRSQSPFPGRGASNPAEAGGQAERRDRDPAEQGPATGLAKKDDTTTSIMFFDWKWREYEVSRATEGTTLTEEAFLAGSYPVSTQVCLTPAADIDILLTEGERAANNRTLVLTYILHAFRDSYRQHGVQNDLAWIDGYTDDPNGVKELCRLHDLAPTLQKAITLANEVFPSVNRLKVSVREDPENEAKWLTVRVVAGCDPPTATSAYGRFITQWVASVPLFKRGLVRLSYGVG